MSLHGFLTPNLLTNKSVEIQGNKIAKKLQDSLSKKAMLKISICIFVYCLIIWEMQISEMLLNAN